MARLMAIRGDSALLPRQVPQDTNTLPAFVTPSGTSGGSSVTQSGFITDSTAPTIATTTPSQSKPTITSSSTTSATNTATSGAATSGGSSISGTTLAEIIAPIAFVVILIPIIYMLWVRHRTRNMNKLESEPRHSPSPSKELKFRSSSPKRRSLKPSFLPPFSFHERGQSKETSLFEEVNTTMQDVQRKESAGLYDRNRDDMRAKESSYGVYSLRRSLEDKGRTDSIGLFDLPRSNDRPSPSQPIQRGPSPTLPSPKVPLFERPPSEAWPLPASKLPDPPALYDPHPSTKKSPSAYTPSSSPPPNIPLPAPPGSRHDNQTYSFASSNVLPPPSPSHQYRPTSSNTASTGYNNVFGSNPDAKYLSGTTMHSESHHSNPSISKQHLNVAPMDSPSSIYNTPATATFSSLKQDEPRGRHRDSDLVSELSYRSPSSERERRTSTDAMSVVSAISHRRRRSERDVDALSMVSVLSPETEDTPRIPIEHYPL